MPSILTFDLELRLHAFNALTQNEVMKAKNNRFDGHNLISWTKSLHIVMMFGYFFLLFSMDRLSR